ncbi:MAG TPA: hypothetical protein VLR49_02505 [Ferruginibacter sp.]|nr:hypothetical protein [Ferruginibacter sp.]
MTEEKTSPTPNFLWSIIAMRCPRCRRGPMFKHPNPYRKLSLKNISDMHDNCPVCNQKYDMEPGFWYGTGYVSYALAVAMSVATFIAWWVFIGVSVSDNRVMYWFIFNSIVLLVSQPWMMRMSRVIYMRIFVSYDQHFDKTSPKEFK